MRRSTRILSRTTGETSRFFKGSTEIKHEMGAPPTFKRRQIKKVEIEIKDEPKSIKQDYPTISKVKPEFTERSIPSVKDEGQDLEIPAIKSEPSLITSASTLNQETKEELIDSPSQVIRPELMEPVQIKQEYIKLNLPDYNAPVNLTEEEQKNLPSNFIPVYTHIKKMRAKIIAPVDTMGCAEIPITLDTERELTPINYRFQLLISLMLSSQTKDEINFKAMSKMKEYFQAQGFREGICLEAIEHVDEKILDQLIFSVGFHSRKAQYIKKAAMIIRNEHNGDIPNTLEGLAALPGVGPKMSYLTLQKAWNLNVGIGVDVHVDRLSKQFKWVNAKVCKNPEITRAELQKWLPKSLWIEINPVLVGFGQSICLSKGRRCDLCTLSRTKLCPNIDRDLLKKVEGMGSESLERMNKTLRFQFTHDIEDMFKDTQ